MLAAMRTKVLRFFLAVFWLVWMAVVMPLHTPGVVPMRAAGGSAFESGGGARGVVVCPFCAASEAGKNSGQKQPPVSETGCALCDVKAKLYTGPVISLELRPLGWMRVAAAMRRDARVLDGAVLVFRSRAPPARAFA